MEGSSMWDGHDRRLAMSFGMATAMISLSLVLLAEQWMVTVPFGMQNSGIDLAGVLLILGMFVLGVAFSEAAGRLRVRSPSVLVILLVVLVFVTVAAWVAFDITRPNSSDIVHAILAFVSTAYLSVVALRLIS
jgi:hypothetical protein